jgi:hypothetical protein
MSQSVTIKAEGGEVLADGNRERYRIKLSFEAGTSSSVELDTHSALEIAESILDWIDDMIDAEETK